MKPGTEREMKPGVNREMETESEPEVKTDVNREAEAGAEQEMKTDVRRETEAETKMGTNLWNPVVKKTKLQSNLDMWLYALFALKAATLLLSAISIPFTWSWLPPTTPTGLLVAGSFLGSSFLFLKWYPPFGLISTIAFGATTLYYSSISLLANRYIAWSLFAAVTGLAFIVLALAKAWQLFRNCRTR